jgi:nitrogen regulatory protein PII
MKNIAILAEQLSDRALAAALPSTGIASITISPDGSPRREAGARQNFHGFRNPARFSPSFRIDLIVEDEAVETVFDGISFAYGAGLFSDAEAWITGPAAAA